MVHHRARGDRPVPAVLHAGGHRVYGDVRGPAGRHARRDGGALVDRRARLHRAARCAHQELQADAGRSRRSPASHRHPRRGKWYAIPTDSDAMFRYLYEYFYN